MIVFNEAQFVTKIWLKTKADTQDFLVLVIMLIAFTSDRVKCSVYTVHKQKGLKQSFCLV